VRTVRGECLGLGVSARCPETRRPHAIRNLLICGSSLSRARRYDPVGLAREGGSRGDVS
jgi:hypothetical protein